MLSDPAVDMVHLMVEVQPVGTDFTGMANASGSFVTCGATARVTLCSPTALAAGSYHWQACAMDMAGAMSAWAGFGGNAESEADFVMTAPSGANPPDVPTGVDQFQCDGVMTIGVPPNATTATHYETALTFKGTVSDPDGGRVRLLVELCPLATAFTGAATHAGDFVSSGTVAEIRVTSGLSSNTSYHWQYAAEDAQGNVSGWTSFGGNTEADSDFRPSATGNVSPDPPSAVGQFTAGGASIGVGGGISESTVMCQGMVSDVNGNRVRLQVEVRPVGMPFAGVSTGESDLVGSGSLASVSVGALDGPYHWQYRATDANGSASAWTAFGANAESEADVRAAVAPSSPATSRSGRGGCGAGEGSGSPLWCIGLAIGLLLLRRR
ncbi:MAG: hypothetical protein HYY16_00085 [Planctomycetes bacterium]|nr:hypothetical protein [Planctomycetota bacterium]